MPPQPSRDFRVFRVFFCLFVPWGVLVCVIDVVCVTETRMGLLCTCAQFHMWSFLLRDKQKAIRSHAHKSYCFTNCSPHPISGNFIYSVFVLRLCYCHGALWGEAICQPPPTPHPLNPAFPSRRLLCLLLCFCIVPLRAEKKSRVSCLGRITQNQSCLNPFFFLKISNQMTCAMWKSITHAAENGEFYTQLQLLASSRSSCFYSLQIRCKVQFHSY